MSPWHQNFNPLGNTVVSTIAAAIPVCTLFYFLAVRRTPAWRAAVYAFLAAVAVALAVFRMPALMVAGAVADGLVFGWFRIAWIVVAAVFVYDISVESGQFEIIKQSIGDISPDRRLQVLLIAFAFGALLEGAGGGGAPVAVTGAMMIGLGFPPFQTALMCLIANSAPVAYGGLGNPVRTLVAVTGLAGGGFQRHARAHPAAHHADPAVLADPRAVQDARHPGGVARAAGLRRHVRRHPVLLVELHGRLAGGHHGRHRDAGGAGGLLPQGLAARRRSGAIPSERQPAKKAPAAS